jgi:Short C-terminal domain
VELFGGNQRLEAKLRESGRPATADVSNAKRAHRLTTSGGQAIGGQNTTATWRLRLHVKPDGEAPFDANLTESIPLGEEISAGQSMAVLYDLNDHRRVAIDHGSQEGIANFAAGLAPVATAAIDESGPRSGVEDLNLAAASGPMALMARRKSNPDGEVANFRRGMSAHPSAGGPTLKDVSSAAAGSSRPKAPADRLAKLADLRDRGALTVAEFEKQKSQILG